MRGGKTTAEDERMKVGRKPREGERKDEGARKRGDKGDGKRVGTSEDKRKDMMKDRGRNGEEEEE